MEAADQAITWNPEQAEAWNNKASALNQMGQYEEGLAAADRAAMLDPNLAEAWVNNGTALIGLKRYSEALSASERVLAKKIPGQKQHTRTGKRLCRASLPSLHRFCHQ